MRVQRGYSEYVILSGGGGGGATSTTILHSEVAGIYSERCCHVTYVNLKSDWFIKIAIRVVTWSVNLFLVFYTQSEAGLCAYRAFVC